MSDLMTDAITHDYDVFIIHASGDNAIASRICKDLTAPPYNFRCLEQEKIDTFKPGKPIFSSIVDNISKARVTLLILTKESFSTSWVSLETILSLEHSVVRKELTLRLLLYDVDVSSIGFLKKGLLECVPDISVDFNKDNWVELLVTKINYKISLPDILPVGCLAHGQVFSHFTGYYVYLLPVLESKLKETTCYKQHPGKFCTKLIAFLPGSCQLPESLEFGNSETGIKIEIVDRLNFSTVHAGKERKIKIPIYRVSKGHEEYFFVADLPPVIRAMYQIEKKGLAKVELKFQIARFFYTMNEVLHHASNHSIMDKAVLVPYNDITEDTGTVVFDAVRTALAHQQHQKKNISTDVRTVQRFLSEEEQFKHDFHILVSDTEKQDRDYAMAITQYLNSKGKTAAIGDTLEFGVTATARWIIYIISKGSIQSEGLSFKCLNVLAESMRTNMLRALPVLVDVEPKDLPSLLKWVTIVSVKDTKYKERLLQTMNGTPIRFEERLPSGDVATGLAWAYILNYLHVALFTRTKCGLDFTGRIENLLAERNVQCGCINKVFLLVPGSCEAKASIADEANRGFPEGLGPVTKVGELKEVIGVNGREYKMDMFIYTDPHSGQSICFVSEYCTPINCMHEMANTTFAGLSKSELYKQAEDFVQLFDSIVVREAVKNKLGDMTKIVQLICYDDANLLTALQEQIKSNMIRPGDRVFAPRQDMDVD